MNLVRVIRNMRKVEKETIALAIRLCKKHISRGKGPIITRRFLDPHIIIVYITAWKEFSSKKIFLLRYTDTRKYPTGSTNFVSFWQISPDFNKIQKCNRPLMKSLNNGYWKSKWHLVLHQLESDHTLLNEKALLLLKFLRRVSW